MLMAAGLPKLGGTASGVSVPSARHFRERRGAQLFATKHYIYLVID
jgi:hypothetical protein